MSLFVLASKDGWVNIMYHGLDAVGVDQQVPTYKLYNNLRKKLQALSFIWLNLFLLPSHLCFVSYLLLPHHE